MHLSTQLVAAACGMRLACLGVVLWGALRPGRGVWAPLAGAVHLVGWVTAVLLAAGAWSLWRAGGSLVAPELRLAVAAAVAAPLPAPLLRRQHWGSGLSLLPAWLAAALALALIAAQPISGRLSLTAVGAALGDAPLASLAALVCAGAGMQAMNEALVRLALPDLPPGWPPPATGVLLTLSAGGVLLASLFTRGTVWPGTNIERGLVAVWLAWSALWVARSLHPRLRDGLVVTLALALSAVAVLLA